MLENCTAGDVQASPRRGDDPISLAPTDDAFSMRNKGFDDFDIECASGQLSPAKNPTGTTSRRNFCPCVKSCCACACLKRRIDAVRSSAYADEIRSMRRREIVVLLVACAALVIVIVTIFQSKVLSVILSGGLLAVTIYAHCLQLECRRLVGSSGKVGEVDIRSVARSLGLTSENVEGSETTQAVLAAAFLNDYMRGLAALKQYKCEFGHLPGAPQYEPVGAAELLQRIQVGAGNSWQESVNRSLSGLPQLLAYGNSAAASKDLEPVARQLDVASDPEMVTGAPSEAPIGVPAKVDGTTVGTHLPSQEPTGAAANAGVPTEIAPSSYEPEKGATGSIGDVGVGAQPVVAQRSDSDDLDESLAGLPEWLRIIRRENKIQR